MFSPLSTKTEKKSRLIWRIKTTESGDMRFVPIKENKNQSTAGGTVFATLTSKIVQNNKVGQIVNQITELGGKVSFVKGRNLGIQVEGNDVESVGDLLDSFGCQWDLN
jgi:hypothetical protein